MRWGEKKWNEIEKKNPNNGKKTDEKMKKKKWKKLKKLKKKFCSDRGKRGGDIESFEKGILRDGIRMQKDWGKEEEGLVKGERERFV